MNSHAKFFPIEHSAYPHFVSFPAGDETLDTASAHLIPVLEMIKHLLL